MELFDAARARRMVRSFSDRAVARELVDRLLDAALRAPSAGNTQGTAWVVLEGPEETSRYWDVATTADWRANSRRWAGLSRAPLIFVSVASPGAYVARYRETDKVGASADIGLGSSHDAWPVPYWFGDAAFGVMTLLLGAVAEGLGACFLGNFRSEGAVLGALGVPEGWRLFGSVVAGYPAGEDPRSASLDRVPPATGRVHYGVWSGRPKTA
ncbi:MAG TPA: nitroreductase family protein [Acidimicrobiales bacterium]|nr:nitroreductase family protein [Acidimicrobiales bacterium]